MSSSGHLFSDIQVVAPGNCPPGIHETDICLEEGRHNFTSRTLKQSPSSTHWMVPVGTGSVDWWLSAAVVSGFCPCVSLTLLMKLLISLLLFLLCLEERQILLWKSQGANKGQRVSWGRFPVIFQSRYDSQFVVRYWPCEPHTESSGWFGPNNRIHSFPWLYVMNYVRGWVWTAYFGCVLNSVWPSVKVVTRPPAISSRSRGSFLSTHLKDCWSGWI